MFLLDPSKKVVALDGITTVCFKFIRDILSEINRSVFGISLVLKMEAEISTKTTTSIKMYMMSYLKWLESFYPLLWNAINLNIF